MAALSKLFGAASKAAYAKSAAAAASPNFTTLKHFVSFIETPSSSSSSDDPLFQLSRRRSYKSSSGILSDAPDESTKESEFSREIESLILETTKRLQLSRDKKSILAGNTELDSGVSWKGLSRERKKQWILKNAERNGFDKRLNTYGQKLGVDTSIDVLSEYGHETGLNKYSALVSLCIDRARKAEAEDKDILLEQRDKTYQLSATMTERGPPPLTKETCGPFLKYLIDMRMVKDFFVFGKIIKEYDPDSLPSFAYYEMLLWISVGAKNKIQELCNSLKDYDDSDKSIFQENYLAALCDGNMMEEVMLLLGTIDITKISSVKSVASIFKSLGRLHLESFAKKFVVQLQTNGIGAEDVSNFIFNYASSMSKSSVEDIALRFKNLHEEFAVNPSRVPCEKLIRFSCDSHKVRVALDIVDWVLEAEFTISIETFHLILDACLKSCGYNLVHRIYSAIHLHKLKPNNETFRIMITLCVKMKDFDSAYAMIERMGKMSLMPTANIYNAIMAGYFREKDFHGGMLVLKQMEDANVKPDSQTFTYIINNCSSDEDINKYGIELKYSGVTATKNIFLALINAYAVFGQFDKAKKVVLDRGILVKSLNETKNGIDSVLESNVLISDANLYDGEIKQVKADLVPKAIISFIEHLPERDWLLLLLEQLKDTEYWIDGCFNVVSYCIRHKHLSSEVDVLKQLKNKYGGKYMPEHWAIVNAFKYWPTTISNP